MPIVGDDSDRTDVPPEIRQAFRRWADRTGGPSGLDELITGCTASDMVMVRVVTAIRRRDLFEQRVAALNGSSRGASRLSPEAIDPFALSLEQLRARSEHLEHCLGCAGAGQVSCGPCAGTGRCTCPECNGSGQIMRYYQKSSRLIQCPGCRAKGTVTCAVCGRSGKVACPSCAGSGWETVWWAYRESVATTLRFDPESPVILAHPVLREERMLQPHDVAAFATLSTASDGTDVGSPYRSAPDDDAALSRLTPTFDPRCEQIAMRQLLRLGVPRQDVQYEMCGARATVVLSGRTLEGSTTPEATAPIQRRRLLLVIAGLVIVILAWQYKQALQGPTAYFNNANVMIVFIVIAASLAASLGVSGLLRAWRPGGRQWSLRRKDRLAIGLLLPVLALGPLVAFAARPEIGEARQAVAMRNFSRARLVLDALDATRPSPELASLRDTIELAEVGELPLTQRILRFKTIATRGGPGAATALVSFQRDLSEQVRADLGAGQASLALQHIAEGSPLLDRDAATSELRALAHDLHARECADDVCVYLARRHALSATTTRTRQAAFSAARSRLLVALAERRLDADLVARVRTLRAITRLTSALAPVGGDAALASAASEASRWAENQRAQIALVGAPLAVVDDLLQRPAGERALTGWSELNGVGVYSAASGDRCDGLYVVGASPGARSLNERDYGVRRLLAQATGRPSASLLRPEPQGNPHRTTRWTEGATPVEGRWSGAMLMELRIGRAHP